MPQTSPISVAFNSIGRSLLDLLFPLKCVGCGKEGTLLCPSCCRTMPRIEEPFCHRCGKPLRAGDSHRHAAGNPDGVRSVFLHQGVARDSILNLKYRNLKTMGPILGRLLAEKIAELPPCDAIVPVPLHHRRLRQRGYNQASLIAREAALVSGLQLVEGSLLRMRDTPSQTRSASREQREADVKGAFRCCDERLEGKCVILVDDVCTTGATLNACAEALRAGGVVRVWGVTVSTEV